MAGTTASTINDLFLTRISDYRLTAIYATSGSAAFTVYLEPWLLDAIVEFEPICDQDLTYTISTGSAEGYFTETLTLENQIILSKLMIISWLGQTVRDTTQFQLFLQDHDYKTHSAAQNLTAKLQLYNATKEELNYLLGIYSYQKNAWDSWNIQDFIP